MTNLVAILSFTITTNWFTVSIEKETCAVLGCAALHLDKHHQRGIVESNTVASVVYKGKTNSVIVDKIEIANLSRSIYAK